MKIVCNVSVGNRLLPGLAINPKRKYLKSTLALCKKPKTEEFCIIVFSTNNKTGTKYDIKSNISAILTRFLEEGKATIQFKQPPHDLYIQGDKIPLKGFFYLLQRAIKNQVGPNEMAYSSMSVTPISSKNIAPTKLVIKSRGQYPMRGFPRTLESLYINEINRCSLDKGILLLKKLRILDLSHNNIEDLPVELSEMECLSELNLSFNEFGSSAPKQWNWIGGNLSKTLKLLNLSSNKLKYLPDQITKLHNIVTLNVDDNLLTVLPSGIGNFRYLKVFTASNNLIYRLPGTAKKWCLQKLDLSNNMFNPDEQNNPASVFPKPFPVFTLREYAARKVLYSRLAYTPQDLPVTVIKFLDLAKYCVCGKACFNYFIRHTNTLSLSSVAQCYSVSHAGLWFVPIDCYFCSLKCFRSTNYSHPRHPIT